MPWVNLENFSLGNVNTATCVSLSFPASADPELSVALRAGNGNVGWRKT